jgi:hypothetical protein
VTLHALTTPLRLHARTRATSPPFLPPRAPVFPGTHTEAFHRALPEPSAACRASTLLPRFVDLLLPDSVDIDSCQGPFAELEPAKMELRRGDIVVMDTRCHHRGGRNASTDGQARVLLQFSFLAPSAQTGAVDLSEGYTNVVGALAGQLPTLAAVLATHSQDGYININLKST